MEFSHILVRIVTGKTHQIRSQITSLGCSILGDYLYSNFDDINSSLYRKNKKLFRLINKTNITTLHSEIFTIQHPLLNQKNTFRIQ